MGLGGLIDLVNQISTGNYVDKYYFVMTIFPDGSAAEKNDPIIKAGGEIVFPLVWFRRELGHERIFGNYEAVNPIKLGHEILIARKERKIVTAKLADLNTGYLDELLAKHEHFDATISFAVKSPNGSELFVDYLALNRAKIKRITRQRVLENKIWETLHISFSHSAESVSD